MISLRARKQLRDFELEVSLEVPPGRCLALVGPTGCGKSTVLRMLAGLLLPDEGEVLLCGTVVLDTARGTNLPPQQRRVGMVFQDFSLFPHLTIEQNVAYGARARGSGPREAREAAREALARVGLQHLARVRPTRLSGGQQQRAALARALASGAQVLLMDEPMSALDAATRQRVRAELANFIKSLGLTTIIVTHDAVDALTLGDLICVMDQGRIIQSGTRRELLARPRTPFVADFLGVNLLSCLARPAGEPGLHEARCGSHCFYTYDEAEGEALLRCNPWDISVSRQEPTGSALNILRARVAQISHSGGRTRILVENGISLIAEITHLSEDRLELKVGDEVYASFKASATHVYH